MAQFSFFHGRNRQLNLLDELWRSQNAELLILYGRRRVGKSRLLSHWIESSDVRAIKWTADPTSPVDQLRTLSQVIYNASDPPSPAPLDFSYANWRQAFEAIFQIAQRERIIVTLDEFTYLLQGEPGVAGILQNAWDQFLCNANLFLCLSGSHIGMMERHLLSYQAPLYGRATSVLQLQPIPFGFTRDFLPRYSAEDRVKVYALFGGIPYYWEWLDSEMDLEKNIYGKLLGEGSLLFQGETRLLLHDFLSDLHNYFAILRAIALGYRIPSEIAGFAGLKEAHLSMYLTNLTATGFVKRNTPITESPASRLGRYHIVDPFLRFYYRFIAGRQDQFSRGIKAQAIQELDRHLADFIGTHTWEELCREWVLRASDNQQLPFMPDDVGSTWTHRRRFRDEEERGVQIDVVGINRMEKTLVLGECKWGLHPVDIDVLSKLTENTEKVVPKEGKWKIYYLGFARSGWTEGAYQYAEAVAHSKRITGANWRSVGMKLLDLNDVDRDLAIWTV